jgi:hypothetical protein
MKIPALHVAKVLRVEVLRERAQLEVGSLVFVAADDRDAVAQDLVEQQRGSASQVDQVDRAARRGFETLGELVERQARERDDPDVDVAPFVALPAGDRPEHVREPDARLGLERFADAVESRHASSIVSVHRME